MDNNLKQKLDTLVKKYETPDFIKNDTIQFLHRFSKFQDIEIAGLIASSLAYGKREAFIEKLNYIFKILGTSPLDFCLNIDKVSCDHYFRDFKYRFNSGADICILIDKLQKFYLENNSFDDYIETNLNKSERIAKNVITMLSEELTQNISSKSYCYLFPSPNSNSACKRLNLFLKWMVRKSPVDIGIWKSMEAKDLIIPLDVHVAKVSRNLNLTSRKSNDWQTAEEITNKLKEFDRHDPIKYDFALFDIGIDKLEVKC